MLQQISCCTFKTKTFPKITKHFISRFYKKYDGFAGRLSDIAMEMTQMVTTLQTKLRNDFVFYIKQRKTESVEVKKRWQEIVQNLTHERLVSENNGLFGNCQSW